MVVIQRFIFCLAFAAGPPCAQAAEQFDAVRGRAELVAIDRLSETSMLAALRRLEALEAQLGPDVSYSLRRDMLRAKVWMRENAGQLDRSCPGHSDDLLGRVLEKIGATPVDAGSCMVPVTMTAGVISLPLLVAPGAADAPGAGFDWERGIRLADWALYQGKAGGRNQARIVIGLGAPVDTVLAKLDAAPGSDGQGLVQLRSVRGPEQAPVHAAS